MSQEMETLKEKIENGEEPDIDDLPEGTRSSIKARNRVVKVLGSGVAISGIVAAVGVFGVIPGFVGLLATGVFLGALFALLCIALVSYYTQQVQNNIMQDAAEMLDLGGEDGDELFPRGFQ